MLSLTFGEQVKIVLSRKNMTIKELAEEIEMKTGKKMSRQNLTQRLGRDNFQEQDMRMIAEILDCPFQLNILSDEDRHGSVSAEIYSAEPAEERKEKKKKGKTIFLEPQTDLFQRMDELSSSERDITIGELVDIHEQLEQLEQEKREDDLGEASVLEYEVPGEEVNSEESANSEMKTEVAMDTDTAGEDTGIAEETESKIEEAPEAEEESETALEEQKADSGETLEASEEQEEISQAEPADAEEEKKEELEEEMKEEVTETETPAENVEEKKEEPEEKPEPQNIQPEPKPVKKKKPLTSVLKGYIRRASKAARDTQEEEKADEPFKEEQAAAPEALEQPEVKAEAEKETEELSAGQQEEPVNETEVKSGHDRRRGPQMMPDGIGEVNPYTGKEYETNSVRMHPNRIGYIQVYDRGEHQWADMTEWAFLGYQERKKALLGDQYEPPIYLD